MKQFEYKTLEDKYISVYELDESGKDGWELVAVQPYGKEFIFYFKREIH